MSALDMATRLGKEEDKLIARARSYNIWLLSDSSIGLWKTFAERPEHNERLAQVLHASVVTAAKIFLGHSFDIEPNHVTISVSATNEEIITFLTTKDDDEVRRMVNKYRSPREDPLRGLSPRWLS